jgi:hypothetical protein
VTTAEAQIAEYEAVLEREGLGAIDCGTMVSQRGQATRAPRAGATDAVDAYLAWARVVLETVSFAPTALSRRSLMTSVTTRHTWKLYADGKSLTEIALELGLARRAVTRLIGRVMAKAPPPPVVNPWMRSGRDLAEIKRSMREGNDDQEEDLTPKPTRAPVEYSCIRLRNDLVIPGIPAAKDHITPMKDHAGKTMPLMGSPHAGGIDVVFPTTIRGKRQVQVITIPWWNIKQAEHAPEEYEAA